MLVDRLKSGVAHGAGEEWIRAGAEFLSVGRNARHCDRLESLLCDMATQEALPRLDAVYVRHNAGRRGTRAYDHGLKRFRFTVLMLMTFRGGAVQDEPPGSIRKRRRRLAPAVLAAAEDIRGLPGQLRLSRELAELADSLKAGKPLNVFDPIALAQWMPQPGRQTSQQTLLERRLCMEFDSSAGSPCYALVASLIAIALNVPGATTSAGVGERWRHYMASLNRR
jgi:hypothetical protein